jgi:hypothetical protein
VDVQGMFEDTEWEIPLYNIPLFWANPMKITIQNPMKSN